MNYTHITTTERGFIADYNNKGYTVTRIAQLLFRSKATISRELARNKTKKGYNPADATDEYKKRKRKCGAKRKIVKGNELYARITEKLKCDWSPEQMVNTVVPDVGISTIYRAFHNKTLTAYAKHFRRLTYQSGWKKNNKRGSPYNDAKTIQERPKEVLSREEVGHWELDTFVFCRKENKVMAVFLERKTRNSILCLLNDRKAKTMKDAIVKAFRALPEAMRKSLTVDRGKEFELWKDVEKELHGTKVYFCDPMRPEQKGAVENTNGLLRQYYPKGKNTPAPTAKELATVQASLNSRPRKKLNYATPYQQFNLELKKVLHLI